MTSKVFLQRNRTAIETKSRNFTKLHQHFVGLNMHPYRQMDNILTLPRFVHGGARSKQNMCTCPLPEVLHAHRVVEYRCIELIELCLKNKVITHLTDALEWSINIGRRADVRAYNKQHCDFTSLSWSLNEPRLYAKGTRPGHLTSPDYTSKAHILAEVVGSWWMSTPILRSWQATPTGQLRPTHTKKYMQALFQHQLIKSVKSSNVRGRWLDIPLQRLQLLQQCNSREIMFELFSCQDSEEASHRTTAPYRSVCVAY